MKHAHLVVLTFAGWLMFCGCTKPQHIHAGGRIGELGPLVREVGLADTISQSFAKDLHLEGTTGSSFEYPSGQRSSYFSYNAQPEALLNALARLPFPLRDRFADVAYHHVSGEEWYALRDTVSEYERSGQALFWDAAPDRFHIIASTKNEDHLLLIEKNGNRIIHRVATRL